MSICKSSMSKILHKEGDFICRLIINNRPYVKIFGHNNDYVFCLMLVTGVETTALCS